MSESLEEPIGSDAHRADSEHSSEHNLVSDSVNAAPARRQFTYGRMFADLPPLKSEDKDLISLGSSMTDNLVRQTSGLPAGYVFLGQFIDHDLSLDPQNQGFPGGPAIDPFALLNNRSLFFNLDILYGDGPAKDALGLYEQNSILLKLGETRALQNGKSFPYDLLRGDKSLKAIVVDSRQDENLPIAQTHVALVKFHNAVAKAGGDTGLDNFEKVKETVLRHYQWIVLHDFLPKLIKQGILDEVLEAVQNGQKTFYEPDADFPFMPVEFSVGAFRMGHSMVPDAYDWNRLFPASSILRLTAFTERGRMGNLSKVYTLPTRWIIDWTRFYDFTELDPDAYKKPTNFSSRIDTSMIPQFKYLMFTSAGAASGANNYQASLATRNLFRGRMLGLPSGQTLAQKMKLPVISAEQIRKGLPDDVKDIFGEHTPLWYYVLKEAEIEEGGERLGSLGSRLMAETMIRLLKLSPSSILNVPDWRPSLCHKERREKFGMIDLLAYVAGQNEEFDELNPLGSAKCIVHSSSG